jgi:cysteinyl-tRNA synthetase
LGNDLHTPNALAELFSFINDNPVKDLNQTTKKKLLSFFRDLNKIFNVWQIEPRPEKKLVIPEKIKKIAEERFEARKNKDWAKSDELRDKLKTLGWAVKDSKEGYELTKI